VLGTTISPCNQKPANCCTVKLRWNAAPALNISERESSPLWLPLNSGKLLLLMPTSTKPRAWKLSKLLNKGCNGFSFGVQDRIPPQQSYGQALKQKYCFSGVLHDDYGALWCPVPRIGGIKRWCASDVCLSVAYIGPQSRTERPIGRLKLAQR